jgi:hypothetical protein
VEGLEGVEELLRLTVEHVEGVEELPRSTVEHMEDVQDFLRSTVEGVEEVEGFSGRTVESVQGCLRPQQRSSGAAGVTRTRAHRPATASTRPRPCDPGGGLRPRGLRPRPR